MPKLTRKAQYSIIGIMVLIIVIVGVFLIPREEVKQSEKEQPSKITLVAENVIIKSKYIDAISKDKSSSDYTACQVVVKKGEKINEYTISQNQTFTKYIQLKGPNGEEVLTDKSKQVITHYAYSCLLTGDIIEKTVGETKTYEIVNARVTYNKVPFALLENENKACYRNKDKTEVKMIKLQEFINALNDVNKRKEIIDW